MTLEPAKRLGLDNKGQIACGCDADITVFDPQTIKDGADFFDLNIPPVGINCVIVNGKIAAEGNKLINGRAGRFISY